MADAVEPQEHLPLDDEARSRVNAGLREALQRELVARPGAAVAFFGEGSIRDQPIGPQL
jgi:hypothetical protein